MNAEILLKVFREELFIELEKKNSWGKNEVKGLVKDLLIHAIIESTKGEDQNDRSR